jgi:hypothetical protein
VVRKEEEEEGLRLLLPPLFQVFPGVRPPSGSGEGHMATTAAAATLPEANRFYGFLHRVTTTAAVEGRVLPLVQQNVRCIQFEVVAGHTDCWTTRMLPVRICASTHVPRLSSAVCWLQYHTRLLRDLSSEAFARDAAVARAWCFACFESMYLPELRTHLCPHTIHELLLDLREEEKDLAKREKTERKKDQIRRTKQDARSSGRPNDAESNDATALLDATALVDGPSDTLRETSRWLAVLHHAFRLFSNGLQTVTSKESIHELLASDVELLTSYVWSQPTFSQLESV